MQENIFSDARDGRLTKSAKQACPACLAGGVTVFHSADDVPANSCILLSTEDEARGYPTGRIDLGYCPECGFIFNTAFDEAKAQYSERYEETQGFSAVFSSFHRQLAERIIEKHDLRGKKIVEIGCGKGEFLILLAQLGDNHGVGIDPSVHLDRIPIDMRQSLKFIPDFFTEDHITDDVGFIACKMTLEHIPAVQDFVGRIAKSVEGRPNTAVFFQVPDALRIMRECAFEDIYYEHCSYFSQGSLVRLFRRAGLAVTDISSEYDGQYLTIEARWLPDDPVHSFADDDDLNELRELVMTFPARFERIRRDWQDKLSAFRREGKTVALWGSGSKAVSFITTLGLGDEISAVTDINPYRQGHFLPKTAHYIVSPQDLSVMKPDVVIAMNRIYRDEIGRELKSLGVNCDLLTL